MKTCFSLRAPLFKNSWIRPWNEGEMDATHLCYNHIKKLDMRKLEHMNHTKPKYNAHRHPCNGLYANIGLLVTKCANLLQFLQYKLGVQFDLLCFVDEIYPICLYSRS